MGFTSPSSYSVFLNDVKIEKYWAIPPKEKIPPPLVLTHTFIKSVHIPKLITEVNRVLVIIVRIINIQIQKLSVTDTLFFGFIHLPFSLNPFNGVATHLEKINRLCAIKRHRNKTGQVGDAIKHHSLHFYPTKKKSKEKENYLVMTNRCRIN